MENMKWIPGVGTLHLYQVSADGGNTWTDQWLTENEVTEHRERLGCLVRKYDGSQIQPQCRPGKGMEKRRPTQKRSREER